MTTHNESTNVCPCGLTKELCGEKHLNLDHNITLIREEQIRIRTETSKEIAIAESRLREHMDTSEAHMLERLGHQKEIGSEITSNIKESYQDGLRKVIEGLDLHRKDIDNLEKNVPTDNINRLVTLEDWIKTLPKDLPVELESHRNFKTRTMLVGTGLVLILTLSFNWFLKLGGSIFKHIFTGG